MGEYLKWMWKWCETLLGMIKLSSSRRILSSRLAVNAHERLAVYNRGYWRVYLAMSLEEFIRACLGVVLEMVLTRKYSSGSGLGPKLDRGNGLYHTQYPDRHIWASFLRNPSTGKYTVLTPIKFFNSHRMRTWCIHKICSFTCSFTSLAPIYNPIDIRWVTVKTLRLDTDFRL